MSGPDTDSATLYLRNVPASLVKAAKIKAAREGTSLTAIVIDALERALGSGGEISRAARHELRESMDWYEANRARLLRQYRGQYVAIVDGAVIDHDKAFEALAARVFGRLGSTAVFMPRVTAEKERVRIRSPRRRAS